ncbi:DUF6602 domain-containing protein [Cupriavidus sp. D39]|uniref:DUF6602 domain-containing protein n=1 Tax=Cupriavidus sp. D39 TaxID=2997877 RepID=UPI002271FBB1|nr:DUF6602 domain-containing protein [Cupriavidus sp. D39]MCY0852505.1 hypothetical protein [Cupriavidus sp. D39]
MSDAPIHDLADFLRRANLTLKDEYNRIQRRVLEDPGTAGDQGEENWAEFLRGWLPKSYTVVTKGRIIGVDGRMSPQIDILVLKPSYPTALFSTKTYLAAGVAAAFECKITVRPDHIRDAVRTCSLVKDLFQARTGTPQRELHSPIVYGLLCHSHAWNAEKSKPSENVACQLNSASQSAQRPRLLLDVLCVADVGTWSNQIMSWQMPPPTMASGKPVYAAPSQCTVATAFVASTVEQNETCAQFSPVSVLLWSVFQKIAREDATMRDLAEYYRHVNAANGSGIFRSWNAELVYSSSVREKLLSENPFVGSLGIDNEWSRMFQ